VLSGEWAVLSLLLAALFFAGIHLGIAGTAIRDRDIGQDGYMAAFAVASAIGLGWLVVAYNRAAYLVTWGMLEWWKPIAIILMLPASATILKRSRFRTLFAPAGGLQTISSWAAERRTSNVDSDRRGGSTVSAEFGLLLRVAALDDLRIWLARSRALRSSRPLSAVVAK
jgi:NnrU protein